MTRARWAWGYLPLVAFCFFSLGLASTRAQTIMQFGGGAGQVTLPAHFERVAEEAVSLAVVSRPHGNVRLFFDLRKLDNSEGSDFGEAFVREQARKKNLTLREIPGRAVFLESGEDTLVDGRQYANLHWHIGFSNTVVVMSATIARNAREAPDVKQFFAGQISGIVLSLQRVGP